MALLGWLILAVASVGLTWLRLRAGGGISALVKRTTARPSFSVGLLFLLATGIGVGLSYIVFNSVFILSAKIVAGAIGAAVIANLGSYAAEQRRTRLDFLQFLTFVKDGFLWASAYPSLAAALGATGPKI